MSDCTDVCEEVCGRLMDIGFHLEDDDSGDHEDVLAALGQVVMIPRRFTLPDSALLVTGEEMDQVRLQAEEQIVDLMMSVYQERPHFDPGPPSDEVEAYEVARRIFLEVIAPLRPDFFQAQPIVLTDEGDDHGEES